MNWPNIDYVLKVSSYLLQPFYTRKYIKPKKQTFQEFVYHLVFNFGCWSVILFSYIVIVYLFGLQDVGEVVRKFNDFYTKPPIDTIQTIWDFFKQSIWANLFFLYIFRVAISKNAERDFLERHFRHHKLSGLIKVIQIGKFDSESRFEEQHPEHVNTAKKHISNMVADSNNERITIVTASGFDLFGNSDLVEPVSPKFSFKEFKNWWIARKAYKEACHAYNYRPGYLKTILTNRNKRFEIVLTCPNSGETEERGKAYLKDKSHKAIKTSQEYLDGINVCIDNIKKASKENPHIEVRIIDKVPEWKMIKLDHEIWVQPIIPGFRSDHASLYGYNNTINSMYHTFFNQIEEIWAQAKKIDLTK